MIAIPASICAVTAFKMRVTAMDGQTESAPGIHNAAGEFCTFAMFSPATKARG